MSPVSLSWKSWLRDNRKRLFILRLLFYLSFAVAGVAAYHPPTLDLLSTIDNLNSESSRQESVNKAGGFICFSTLTSSREQEGTHVANSPQNRNSDIYMGDKNEQDAFFRDSKRKHNSPDNNSRPAKRLNPEGASAKYISTGSSKSVELLEVSPIQRAPQEPSDLLEERRAIAKGTVQLNNEIPQLAPSSKQTTAANGGQKISFPQVMHAKMASHAKKNMLIPPKIIGLGEYWNFRNEHASFTRPEKSWDRACSINTSGGVMGSAELSSLELGKSKEGGFLALVRSHSVMAHRRQSRQERFMSNTLAMISYATRATLHKIKILHHLYEPPLFGNEISLQHTQEEGFETLKHFWKTLEPTTAGEQPAKIKSLKELIDATGADDQVEEIILENKWAAKPGEKSVIKNDLKTTQKIFPREELLAEKQLQNPTTAQRNQNRLAWIATFYWLRTRIPGLYDQLLRNKGLEQIFKTLVDDKGISEAICAGIPMSTKFTFKKEPKLIKDWSDEIQ